VTIAVRQRNGGMGVGGRLRQNREKRNRIVRRGRATGPKDTISGPERDSLFPSHSLPFHLTSTTRARAPTLAFWPVPASHYVFSAALDELTLSHLRYLGTTLGR